MRRFMMVSIALVVISLSACATSNLPDDSPTKVGGMTECTVAEVQPAITAYVESADSGNQMPISNLECADGWAVASGILGPKNAPSDGPQGAPTSIILEAEGQFWIVKEKSDVCGSGDPAAPDAVPTDALVPPALYRSGCLAG